MQFRHFFSISLLLGFVSGCSSQLLPVTGAGAPINSTPMSTLPASPTVSGTALPAASACQNPAPLTPALTEGPYFKAGSPERSSLLEPGMSGTKLVLTGVVMTADCKPVAGALLDFWQADAQGQYDNQGYTLRGYQTTDQTGHYRLETVVPGEYPGRTVHIHVKVQAPGGPVLTTQLFFPGVSDNQSDGIFDPAMLITVQKNGDPVEAIFNFVVEK